MKKDLISCINVLDIHILIKDFYAFLSQEIIEKCNLTVPNRTVEKLQSHVNTIIETLPDDLQNVLK